MLSHMEGYEKFLKLKNSHPVELELICLNSEFFDEDFMKKNLTLYKSLCEEIGLEKSLIKKSEAHKEDQPYYECSVFSCLSKAADLIRKIQTMGLQIDIIHYNGNEFNITDFRMDVLNKIKH